MESPVQDFTVDETFDLLRDPYPLFTQKRRESGVFKGSVMDWSKTPDSMLPEHLYAAVSFDAVNRVFRDGKVFNSHIYDSTIGLFIGPTILAMEGKKHWEHRNLVSAAFKSRSLVRWEPEIVRPVINALIDEFVGAGEADLVRGQCNSRRSAGRPGSLSTTRSPNSMQPRPGHHRKPPLAKGERLERGSREGYQRAAQLRQQHE